MPQWENIALGCVPQPDEIPRDLLTGAIGQCAGRADPDVGCGTAMGEAARTLTDNRHLRARTLRASADTAIALVAQRGKTQVLAARVAVQYAWVRRRLVGYGSVHSRVICAATARLAGPADVRICRIAGVVPSYT
jgi:hypothetical protein